MNFQMFKLDLEKAEEPEIMTEEERQRQFEIAKSALTRSS
jgi:hypothetical protein